jgi:hypothetical protein
LVVLGAAAAGSACAPAGRYATAATANAAGHMRVTLRFAGPHEVNSGPRINMITLEDCIAFCGLTEEEVLAIAEHEHLPEIAATALAEYLLSQDHGSENIRDMIVDDIRQAQRRGDKGHVLILLHVLHHFLKTHPEATPSHHSWSGRTSPDRIDH